MKRISKRISVLILCATLFYANVHLTYLNTFTLEVQAAEIAITAEVGAAAIEYLWGLLLTMGLVSQVDSWSARVSAIDSILDSISEYPELSDDMTLAVIVDAKETTVTLDQIALYIKHTVNGTLALQAKEELFKVLDGGGGKNGGDKDREVQMLAGGVFTALFVSVSNFVGNALEDWQENLDLDLTVAQIAAVKAASQKLALTAPAYAQENAVRCIIENNGVPVFINNYHMDFIDKYNLSFEHDGAFYQNVSVGFREDNGEVHYTQISKYYNGTVSEPCILCIIPAQISRSPKYMRLVVIKFNLALSKWGVYGAVWGNSIPSGYNSGVASFGTGSFRNELVSVSYSEYENVISSIPTTCNGYFYNSTGNQYQHYLSGDSSIGNLCYKNYTGVSGFADIGVYCSAFEQDNYYAMPVLYCSNVYDMQKYCDALASTALEDWDYSIFANSNERIEPLTVGSACSKISQDSLKELADAMINGGMSTDEVIDAAQAVDALREVETPRLPELYPELYPEYQPGVNPADYPDVYPDYDPVMNPNPAPSVQPDPDKVIESVTKPEPEQKPNPNPDDDDDWDTIDLTERFPFCIPFDLIHAFKLLVADAEAPYWEIPLHYEFFGHVLDYTFVIDMSQFETLAKVFRTCETIGFCIGLLLITRNIIRG